jgi:hypothetical protein
MGGRATRPALQYADHLTPFAALHESSHAGLFIARTSGITSGLHYIAALLEFIMKIKSKIDNTDTLIHFDGQSLFINDVPVPMGRLAQMLEPTPEDVLRQAVNGLHFRTDEKLSVIATAKTLPDDVILFEREDYDWRIVERVEAARPRPLVEQYGLIVARAEFSLDDLVLSEMNRAMKAKGLVPIAMVERKVFFGEPETRLRILKDFDLLKRIPNHRELITRLGVVLKRPGGRSLPLTLKGAPFEEAEGDGMIAISTQVMGPMAGTFFSGTTTLKGIVRPPLEHSGIVEDESFCVDAQFGVKVDANTAGEFHAVRTLTEQPATMNLQALMFGVRHPEQYIADDNQRVARTKTSDLVRQSFKAKVEAGIPAGLLMDRTSPWKWLRKFAMPAFSSTVFASTLVKDEEAVMLLPQSYDRLCRIADRKIKVGETLILHRDPAKPDHTSFHKFTFAGICKWAGKKRGEGVVLHPKSKQWKASGGDFDGDMAIVSMPNFEIMEDLPGLKSYRRTKPTPMVGLNGKPHMEGTLLAMTDTFANSLGSTVLTALKAREINALDDAMAAKLSDLIQAAVDNQKHPVNAREARTDYTDVYNAVAEMEPETGFLTTLMNELTSTSGEKESDVVAVWKQLVLWAEISHKSRFHQVMAERIQIIDRIFKESGFLRGHRLGIPEAMKGVAKAVVTELENSSEQMHWVATKAKEFRTLMREMAALEDDDAKRPLREELNKVRREMELAYFKGQVAGATLLAYAPPRIAAEIVSAEDIAALNAQCTEGFVGISAAEEGTFNVEAVKPIDSDLTEWNALTAGATEVTVTILEEKGGWAKCHIRTEGQKSFDLSELSMDSDDEDPFFA